MIKQTRDLVLIQSAIEPYSSEIKGLILEDWLARDNVALTNEYGDVSLFERQYGLKNTVCGHYFFHSRGRKAIDVARTMLAEIFSDEYRIETITGLTPVDHKAALWMNRRLGFHEHGVIDTDAGPHQFVVLTKQEWLQQGGSE